MKGMIGGKALRLGIGHSVNSVGVKVEANAWGYGINGTLSFSGSFTPEQAREFAANLTAKADAVAARNTKREAEDQRRRERLAKLPSISWR